MLTDCCFVGTEVEGPEKGAKTFFIADHYANPFRIADYMRNNPDITHVYFGAGRNYGVSNKHIPLLNGFLRERKKVLVEVSSPVQLQNISHLNGITIVLAVKTDAVHLLQMGDVRIKLEDNRNAVVFSNSVINQNGLDNPVYEEDTLVKL